MPATLKSLQEKVVPLVIAIDDDPEAITLKYRPHNMTANIEEKVQAAAKEGRELEAVVEMTLPVLAEWDFRMDHGEPTIPVTKDGLSQVPSSILLLVLEAIGKDRTPDPNATDAP